MTTTKLDPDKFNQDTLDIIQNFYNIITRTQTTVAAPVNATDDTILFQCQLIRQVLDSNFLKTQANQSIVGQNFYQEVYKPLSDALDTYIGTAQPQLATANVANEVYQDFGDDNILIFIQAIHSVAKQLEQYIKNHQKQK